MYTLLIVEDENKTRSALRECISWESLGITEIAEAINGKQALEVAASCKPDIVITDIRMPEMDGLELANHLTRANTDVSIIIVSAYSQLSYLRSAMKYHAVDYILKPVDVKELEQAVRSAIERLEKAREKKKINSIWRQNLPVLQEEFLKSLLIGKRYSEEELKDKLESLQLPQSSNLIFNVLRIEAVSSDERSSFLSGGVIRKDILSVVQSQTKTYDFNHVLLFRQEELIIIVGLDQQLVDGNGEFVSMGLKIKHIVEDTCSIRLDVFAGDYVSGFELLDQCYASTFTENDEPTDILHTKSNERDSKLVSSIKSFIEKNYMHENLTIKQIADHLCYTSAYVCMIFKKATGITLNNYINLYRINKSKALLDDVSLKLFDIATMVGYSSENYYSKVFKKYEGISPSDYKKGGA